MARSYSSHSLDRARKTSKPWKLFLLIFIIGFVSGFIVDLVMNTRKPIDLVISTPPPETVAIVNQNEMWSESDNISIKLPVKNSRISSPFTVGGQARTFESAVLVRLKDSKGQEMAKVFTTAKSPDVGIHGPYVAEISFDLTEEKSGQIEVFQESAKDGSEIDKVVIPIRF